MMSKSRSEQVRSTASDDRRKKRESGKSNPVRTDEDLDGPHRAPDLDDIIADLFGFPVDRAGSVEEDESSLPEGESADIEEKTSIDAPLSLPEGVAADLGEGTQLGRCRLHSLIGNGSMGVVWKGWHTTLEIPVAVKILRKPDDESQDAELRERFRQEAHIAALVNHTNLVHVLDFGEDHGYQYLVMELVEGITLESWLDRQSTFDEKTALNAIGHICIGLAELHYVGVVHRDIKPSNILVDPGRSLKISDLGFARDTVGCSVEIAGTPHFMAPECQEAGRPFDQRSDLYAVGVILYRMIMGRLPFEGTTREVLEAHLEKYPDLTLPEGSTVDTGTLFILRRLLEKKPEHRMQTAREVVQACRDQAQRLDTRERLRAERLTRPSPVADKLTQETARTSLATRMRTNLDKVRATAMHSWVPWVAVGIIAAAIALLLPR